MVKPCYGARLAAEILMRYLIRFFPEITIKTPPVRHRLIQVLRRNLRIKRRLFYSRFSVTGDWDILEVQTPDDNKIQGKQVLDILLRIEPGQLSGALLLCAASVREGIHLPQYGCC